MTGVENLFIQGKPKLSIHQDLGIQSGKHCEVLVPQKSCIYVLILHVILNVITGYRYRKQEYRGNFILKLDTIACYASKQKISV